MMSSPPSPMEKKVPSRAPSAWFSHDGISLRVFAGGSRTKLVIQLGAGHTCEAEGSSEDISLSMQFRYQLRTVKARCVYPFAYIASRELCSVAKGCPRRSATRRAEKQGHPHIAAKAARQRPARIQRRLMQRRLMQRRLIGAGSLRHTEPTARIYATSPPATRGIQHA